MAATKARRAERNATGDAGGQNEDSSDDDEQEQQQQQQQQLLLAEDDDDDDEGNDGDDDDDDDDDDDEQEQLLLLAEDDDGDDGDDDDDDDEDDDDEQEQQLLLAEDDDGDDGDDDNDDDDDDDEQEQQLLLAEDDDDDEGQEQETAEGDNQVNLGNNNEEALDEDNLVEEDENRITLQDMRDGVVGTGTKGSYLNEIITFIRWCRVNQPTWLTTFCQDQMTDIEQRVDGLGSRVRSRGVENLLRNATTVPLFHLALMRPEPFMVYIEQCRNGQTGKYLSKSAYGGKRSALLHLFRLHNEIGFPEAFQARLEVLYKGFFRNLTKGKTGAVVGIGTHSIRKGAASIRAGWTMNVY
jgi:hypothetical protein